MTPRKIAIFDFCKTLVSFDTHDPFVRFVLWQNKYIVRYIYVVFLTSMFVRILEKLRLITIKDRKAKIVGQLSGIHESVLSELAIVYAKTK